MLHIEPSKPKLPWHAVLCTAVLVLFTVVWSTQAAFASDSELVGRIEAMPSEGLIGNWTVDGFDFVTSGATTLRQEKGEFAIGRCVEVEYVTVAAQSVATQLTTKSDDDCRAEGTPTVPAPEESSTPDPGETATATPEPTATDDHGDDGEHGGDDGGHEGDDDGVEIRAVVDKVPEGSLRGTWIIGGTQFEVGSETRIRQKEGPLREGACVEIRYTGNAEPYTVLRLETERRSKCERTPGGTIPRPTSTPEGNTHEIYGLLNSFPDELFGEWVINGTTYRTMDETEFEQEHGAFEVGICVKAHLSENDPTVIREIETTSRFHCGGSDEQGDNAHGYLFGMIQEFPADLMGEWQIGGTTVTADAATEFKQRGVAFDKDVMVRVHFIVLDDGTFYAVEIETKYGRDDDGEDDDHNGVYEGAEGHAYGLIESLPEREDLLGEWVVAGITYTITSDTQFVKPHSDFAVDVMVRVKYRIDDSGKLVARQIKTTRGNGGASSHDHATLFGFVDKMPASGYVGEWTIDDIVFYATEKTKFKEENGIFGLGSYVKMEYYTVDGRNMLHEIESEVPPGAGDNSTVGEIETIEEEGSDGNAVSSAAVSATVWTIGGRQYVVTPATDLNEFQGALEVGQEAYVNSYTATDGSEVATQIRGVALDYNLFLPTVNR